jgi:hypothetical protein
MGDGKRAARYFREPINDNAHLKCDIKDDEARESDMILQMMKSIAVSEHMCAL